VVKRVHITSIRQNNVIAVSLVAILFSTLSLVGCQAPTASLTIELKAVPNTGPAPLQVNFSVIPAGGNLPYETLVLNLGDGTIISISTGEVYTHIYSKPDKYTVTATVIDSEKNKSSDDIIIDVLAANFVPGVVIVGYVDSNAASELRNLIPTLGGEITVENGAGKFFLVRVEDGNEGGFIKLILQEAPDIVAYAELNYLAEAQVK